MKKKIYLMITDAGGGHRSSANALQEVIEQRQLPWEVHIVNFYKDIVGAKWIEDYYNNFILKQGWTRIYWPLTVPLFRQKIQWSRSAWLARLKNYWNHQKPDLVVSLMPFVNKQLCESLQRALPAIPFLTVEGDFVDSYPGYWIDHKKQFLICHTEKAVEEALSLGIQEDRIFRNSGRIIHPRFYKPITVDRRLERKYLGLDTDLPTGLVSFGSRGSKVMLDIAKCLEQSSLNLQLIFICGCNEKLASTLRFTKARFPKFVETFTTEIPYYMHLSDFLIGKPGLSTREATVMNLPVVTECNSSTMLQELSNVKWIEKNNLGIVVRNFREIDRAIAKLIEPKNLVRYQENAAAINNQGVFEVVDILGKILSTTS
ncbi:MAG: hypothetical protein QNJ54_10850 [Prochloraceae cyanobacterium]|nr:hypothetical protein [Prochloraceae cyanobacterium]